jgi:hypothetical protein
MKQIENEYYGDSQRWFVATVIDGSPPYGLEGRIKIRIHGIHSETVNDIPQADLPWAQVMMPGNFAGVSGLGGSCQLLPGALVFGMFLDGKASQLPLVLGSIPKTEYPTSVQAAGRDDVTTNPFGVGNFSSHIFGVEPKLADQSLTGKYLINNKRNIAMKFFIDNGYYAEQAAGIVGVLENMSKLDQSFDDGTRIGLAGWEKNSPRWERLLHYAGRFQPARNYQDYEIQLTFILHELRTVKNVAHSKLVASREVKGNNNTARVDSRLTRDNGTAEIFRKSFLSAISRQNTRQSVSEQKAKIAFDVTVRD